MQKITYFGNKNNEYYENIKEIQITKEKLIKYDDEDIHILGDDFNNIYNNYLNDISLNADKILNYEPQKSSINIFKENQPNLYLNLISNDYINEKAMKWLKSFKDIKKNELLNKNGGFFMKNNNQNYNNFLPLLFYGPPGTGKTTLAKIIAKTQGFKEMVINGSDCRGSDLINIVNNINISSNIYNKPTLLVIDECDGIIETDNNKVISSIIENILNKDKTELKYKKPIIFICNDPYTRGVKELRKYCIKLKFNKPKEELEEKVKEIVISYRKIIDDISVLHLCRDNNYDIRGTLNQLQILIQENSINKKIQYKQSLFFNRNINKMNIYELFDLIFNKNLKPIETIFQIKNNLSYDIDYKLGYNFIIDNLCKLKIFNNLSNLKQFYSYVCDNLKYKSMLNNNSLRNYLFIPFYYICYINKYAFQENWDFPIKLLNLNSAYKKNKSILNEIIFNLNPNYIINRNKSKLYEEINYIQLFLRPNIKKSVVLEENDKELIELAVNILKIYNIDFKIIEENNELKPIYTPNIFNFGINRNKKLDIKTQIHIIKYLDNSSFNNEFGKKMNNLEINKLESLNSLLKVVRYKYNVGVNEAVNYDLSINYFN